MSVEIEEAKMKKYLLKDVRSQCRKQLSWRRYGV
jgi:hypothetical protein